MITTADDEAYGRSYKIENEDLSDDDLFCLVWNYGTPRLPLLPRMGVQIPYNLPNFTSNDDKDDADDNSVKDAKVTPVAKVKKEKKKYSDLRRNHFDINNDDETYLARNDDKENFLARSLNKLPGGADDNKCDSLESQLQIFLAESGGGVKNKELARALLKSLKGNKSCEGDSDNLGFTNDTQIQDNTNKGEHSFSGVLNDHNYCVSPDVHVILENMNKLEDKYLPVKEFLNSLSEIGKNICKIPKGLLSKVSLLTFNQLERNFDVIFSLLSDCKLEDKVVAKVKLINLGGIMLEHMDVILDGLQGRGGYDVVLTRMPVFLDKLLHQLNDRRNLGDIRDALRNLYAKARDTFGKCVEYCSSVVVESSVKDQLEKVNSLLRRMSQPLVIQEKGCFTYASKQIPFVNEPLSLFDKEEIINKNPGRVIKFCLSQKNKTLMLLDNFLLRLTWVSKSAFRWCCINEKCKYKVSTKMGTIFESSFDHCHETNQEQFIRHMLRTKVKSKSYSSMGASAAVIVQESIGGESYKDLRLHGTTDSLKKLARRVRNKNLPQFTIMKNISDLELHPDMFLEERNSLETLLLFDNKISGNRVIVMGRKSHLKLLCESKIWLGDGTFATSPKVGSQSFGQLYTIAGRINQRLFILLRVLMERRQKKSYSYLFNWIKESAIQNDWKLSLELLLTDFELAPHAAKRDIFGDSVKSKGCRFHFSQSIIKEVNELKMKKDYFEDEDFEEDVRKLMSLAFVPEDDIVRRFLEVKAYLEAKDSQAVRLLDRLDIHYVRGEKKEGKLIPPRFPPSMWCMAENVFKSMPCTTNFLEGSHNSYKTTLTTINHPNIASFSKVLADDCKMIEKDIQINRRNPAMSGSSNREKRKAESIKNISQEYKPEMKSKEFLNWLDDLSREAKGPSENLTKPRVRPENSRSKSVSVQWVKCKKKRGSSSSNVLKSKESSSEKSPDSIPDSSQLTHCYCPACQQVCRGVVELKNHISICKSYLISKKKCPNSFNGYLCPGCKNMFPNISLLNLHLPMCSQYTN